MKRYLFCVLAEKGHLHPFIGPAQVLVARGHRVGFTAPVDLRAALAGAGLEQVLVDNDAPCPLADANRGARFAELVADPQRLRRWIEALLVDTVPSEVDRLTRVADAFQPDVIVADPMGYAAPIVAARMRIPWAALSTSLNPVVPEDWTHALIETTRGLARDAMFKRYGMRAVFRVCDCLSEHLNVVFSTPELVGRPPAHVLLAGPSQPHGARGDRGEQVALQGHRPLVYMSLGSQIYHQPRMFDVVVDALADAPVEVVLAMGDLERPLPAHMHRVGYADQPKMLQRAAVMISHCGANSVMEALVHGVPLLLTPICNDQVHNARFVAQAGAGIACNLDAANAQQVRNVVDALLTSARYRDSARAIARSYRARDGAVLAADAVMALS